MLNGNEKVPFKSRFGEQKFLESGKCGGKPQIMVCLKRENTR